MVVFDFRKKIECLPNCHQNYTLKVKSLVPSFKDGVNGHITLIHSKPYHRVFVTFYNDAMHENWSLKKIKKTKLSKTQKKFSGELPTKSELENL